MSAPDSDSSFPFQRNPNSDQSSENRTSTEGSLLSIDFLAASTKVIDLIFLPVL